MTIAFGGTAHPLLTQSPQTDYVFSLTTSPGPSPQRQNPPLLSKFEVVFQPATPHLFACPIRVVFVSMDSSLLFDLKQHDDTGKHVGVHLPHTNANYFQMANGPGRMQTRKGGI